MEKYNGWTIHGEHSRRISPKGKQIVKYLMECPQCKQIYGKTRSAVSVIKTCRSCYEKNSNSHIQPTVDGISGRFIKRLESGVKGRNKRKFRMKNNIPLKVTVTLQDLANIFKKQNGKCALSGDNLTLPKTCKDYTNCRFNASIDRIDSNKDYSADNIQWVTKKQQKMKMELTNEEYVLECKKVANTHP